MKTGMRHEAKGKSMSRRACAVVLCAVLLALSSGAQAQPAKKVYRVGYISSGAGGAMEAGMRQGLRDLGYVEGQNLVIDSRSFGGEADGLPGIIGELVRMKVDAIIVGGTQVALAAKKATQTIPIIFAIADNPVESGVVASLARPGGNLTGVTDIAGELGGKRIELLKESIPKISRLAVLSWKPDGPGNVAELHEIESAGRVLGVDVHPVEVSGPDALANSFSAMTKAGVRVFMGLTDTRFAVNRQRVVDLAAKHRLPAIYPERLFVEAGGLMSYGTNRAEWRRRVVYFIDRILKGAKPADLPVEQPMKFEFVINLKTAKQIGVTIPPNVLARADRVIR
jgi:putative ABC transport system substrate-binding protein